MSETFKYAINGISGIWNSYGCIPDPGQSISVSLEDHGDGDESLKDMCGFDGKPQDIGQLADSKEISELVVLLPFVLKYTRQLYVPGESEPTIPTEIEPCQDCPDIDPCEEQKTYPSGKSDPNDKRFIGLYWSPVEQAYLFKIKEELVNKILGVEDYKKLNISLIKSILDNKKNINKDNNIAKLMLAMVNYNIPPHLNWLLFNGSNNKAYIPPLAFYTVEYKHMLTKYDLSNIWQGTMPDISQNPASDEDIEIEHFLSEEEIFGGYDINNYDINMRIFKCKKRANNSYKKDVLKSGQFLNLDPLEGKWYHSNWPYDNFSLVELLKVEAGEVHDYSVSGSNPADINGVLTSTTTRTFTGNDGVTVSFTPGPNDY